MYSIYLIGFMGSGKTTVGRLLAERLGWSFIDLDRWITDNEGRTIPEIFSERGEAGFRVAERRALSDTVEATNTVVAAGGGLFCDPENRRLISEAGGWSVFLDLPWTILEARLGPEDLNRPLWDSPSSVRALFEQRQADYRLADAVITIGAGEKPSDVVEAIILLRPELACAI